MKHFQQFDSKFSQNISIKFIKVLDQNQNHLKKTFSQNSEVSRETNYMKGESIKQKRQAINLSQFLYEPFRDLSHLSPYHERVFMQRINLSKKQKIRSILIMGHLQKMSLNAINNRSIETMRKSKVAEEMSKKRYCSVDQTLKPQPKFQANLMIDNRKKSKTQRIQTQNNPDRIQIVYDQLIDDYLKQVSEEKLLKKGISRDKIIQEACSFIKIHMDNKLLQIGSDQNQSPTKSALINKKTLSNSENSIYFPAIKKTKANTKSNQKSDQNMPVSTQKEKSNKNRRRFNTVLLKSKPTLYSLSPSNKREVIEFQCRQNLKKLSIEQKYLSKQRMKDKKLFLRKIQKIGIKT